MADGNLGSLWMSLGLKETVTDGLKKVLSSLDKTDEKSAAVGKEIKSFVKELNSAKVSDSILKSIGRIGELLSVSTSGAESLGRVLKGLNVKEMSALGGNVNMSNLKEAHSLITKIMQAMSSRNMSNASMDKFFELGNAQGFLTQIMTIDKNLKSLKDSSKGITDTVLKGDAETLVNKLTSLRKQFLESFNSGAWRGNNAIQGQLNNATNSLIQFYDKLNASKGNQSLFDSVPKEAAKATEALKAAEEQAKKTAEAVASIGTKRKPAVENPELAKEIERLTKNPVSMKEGSNDFAGIKKQADDASKSVIKLKYDLNEVLNAFRGSASKNLGVGEAGEKGRQLVDILNQINKKKEELSRKEGGAEAVKEMGAMVNNAMSYLRLLQRIEIAERGLQEKKSANPNVDASKFKEASNAIAHFRDQLVKLESAAFLTGVDGANVLKNYASAWQMTLGDVDKTIGKFQKRNPLSDLDSNFSKIDSKIDSFREKLAKLRDLMSEGTHKGFNTSMLTDRITGMSGIVAQMEKAMNNEGKMLSNADRMKQLFSDMQVEMSKTTAALQAYGREKGKAIAQERESNAAIEKSKRAQRELADNTRNLKDLYSQLNHQMAIAEQHGMKGLQLGVSTSQLDKALSDMRDFASIVNGVSPGLMGKGGRPVLADYKQQANDLKRALLEAVAAQKELNNAQERSNRKAEAKSERDKAQAIREQNAAEKQRQAELENSLRRIQSMEKALANLQEKRFTSKMLGLDISEADAKIFAMKIKLNELYDIANKLRAKDMTAVGKLGNLGNGRETQAANDLARSYDKANKEAQRGVEIEQKRQQEIAKSAAKARNDLASAFAGANAEARKMQSIVGDIKSLFLQGGIVFGAQQFFNSIVQTGGEIVQQHIALRSILGDVQKADELFNQTQQLALQSPFKFGELNRDVKQLAAFGVEANDLYETTKRLADIASGLGVSFERLGLAYGQVKARSWLDGKELRQFAYAGLPLLQRITEMYNREGKNGKNNYTEADVKKMISTRDVSFNDVQKVLWEMTDEGGQFYNMQFVLSETLLGKWNKLIDAWEIMLGKFAEGRSVIGGTFKYAISGATDLVLALDKLSPLLLSLGGTYIAKKGIGALYDKVSSKAGIGGMLSRQKEVADARLREYAIQQQQLVIEKQITQEKATQKVAAMGYALTSKEEQVNAMQRLALEGRLSVMQMQKAYREGLITPELLSQLEVMGMISTKQKEIIANATIENRVRAAGMTMMNGVGKLFTWSNAAFVGISVAIGAVMQYFQKAEEVEQRSKDIATSAQQRINSLKEALSATKNINKDTDSSEVEKVNEQLQEVLEQSGLFTETIKEQISQASTLTEKYQILKGAVNDAKEASSIQGKFSDAISKAIDSSGGFLNDDIAENVKDVMESYNKMQTLLAGLDDATKERMSSIANQFLKPEQASLSLEEKIDLLADMSEDDFDRFVRAASNGSNDIAHSLYLIRDRANITKNHFDEIAKDDVPKILEVIRVALGKNEKEFRSWAQHNVKSFDSMFMKIIELCNANVPTIVTKLRKIFYESVGLNPPKEPSKSGNKPKPYDSGLKAGGAGENARKKLQKSGKLNKSNYKLYDAELRIYDSESSEAFGENLRKQYKEIRNENNARKKAGRKVSAESLARQKRIEEIASVSGVSLDVGKDRVTGDFGKDRKNGRQEDSELKSLQERLSSLKSARQMYQKYSSIMSDEEAADKTYKLFPEVKGLDLKDYQVAVRKLLDGFKINTTDRKKFQTSVYREVAEWLFSEKDKKEFDKKAADYTEEMNKLSDRWDLYKSLLEKTGNKEFARSAWVDAFQTDEKSKSLMDLYYQKYKKIFNMQEALSLTDGDAKEKLKGAGEYELWKKIVDLLRGNYVQSLQDGADAMQKMASYADKIRVINKKYDEKVKNQNDPVVVARMNRMRNQELGAASEEEFKGSSDYINFYGAIMSLGMDKAQKIGENIRKYLNDALSSGRIDAREYAKELKLLNEQLSKLTSPRKTFFNGGLKGLAEQKIQDANEQYTLASSKIAEGMKVKNLGEELGDDNLIARGNSMIESGKAMAKAASILFKDGTKAKESLDKFAGVVSVIDQNVQGMVEAFNDVKETAALLGADTESDAWQDASAFFETFSGMSNSISKVVSSAENGNIGGILAGTVGVFTSPIKSFAKAHDAKLDRQINLAERQLTELKNLSANISAVIEKTLGGIYAYQRSDATASKLSEIKNDYQAYNKLSKSNFWGTIIGGKNLSRYSDDTYNAVLDTDKNYSAYADQLALLKAQRDELQKQRNSEADKKKKDKDKLADYDQQLEEMGLQIKTFAQDFLKDIYSIDMKSWASELADAVVGAWEKGEDAVDAYKDKVKSLVKDVTKSIVTQKFMEKALKKPLEFLTSELDKNGKLDESSMTTLVDMLYNAGEEAIPQITKLYDMLKERGLDLRENGSSSTTNSIKGVTEETADLLASYINDIRLNVSVDRENIKLIADAVTGLPELNVIAQSQLTAMNQLVTLAEYRNSKLDDMYSWMRAVTSGTGTKSIRMN